MTNMMLRQRDVDAAVKALYPGSDLKREFSIMSVQTIPRNIRFLLNNSPETLQDIIDASNHSTLGERFWREILKDAELSPLQEGGYVSKSKMRDYLVRYRSALIAQRFVLRAAALDPSIAIRGLGCVLQYEYLAKTVLAARRVRDVISDEAIEALVLIAYVRGIHLDPTRLFPQADELLFEDHADDITYIASRLPEVWNILPMLVERKAHDRCTIDMLLSADAPALAVGLI